MTKNNLICHLVQNTCHSQYQNRIGIYQHSLRQWLVKTSVKFEIRNHQYHDDRGANQIKEKGIKNMIIFPNYPMVSGSA
jgi:protoheme ferro-lyase